MSRFSRFDVILIFILAFAVGMVGTDVWLKINGYGELSSYVWTFAGTLTGGEIVAFSLYQITKEVAGAKASKQFLAKHAAIKETEEETNGNGNAGADANGLPTIKRGA